MSTFAPLIFLFVVAVAILAVVVKTLAPNLLKPDGDSKRPTGLPVDAYSAKPSLLTEAERTFLYALDQALPPNTRVFVQVALSAIVSTRQGSESRQRSWNRIAQKVADFVVCDQWCKPLVVIELDDSSHKKTKRAARDELLDSILGNVGLRLLHVRAAGNYDVSALRAELLPPVGTM